MQCALVTHENCTRNVLGRSPPQCLVPAPASSAPQWRDPRELHLVGVYAADAYALFCRGAWSLMEAPADKDLVRYWTWLRQTSEWG